MYKLGKISFDLSFLEPVQNIVEVVSKVGGLVGSRLNAELNRTRLSATCFGRRKKVFS